MDPSDTKYDEYLMQFAGQVGNLNDIFVAFFGFLYRKTDFYIQYNPQELLDENGKMKKISMGFPPGKAEKMLLDAFRRYPFKPYVDPNEYKPSNKSAALPPPSSKPSSSNMSIPRNIPSSKSPPEQQKENNSQTKVSALQPDSVSSTSSTGIENAAIRLNEEGKQIPIGNGGIAEKYYWTQTLKELTVYINLDPSIKSKEIQCTLKPKQLKVLIKGESYVEGELEEVIKSEESMWTFNTDKSNPQLIISLDKVRPTWWKYVLKGDPEIDTTKVDSTQRVDEYDEETQAAIRKIMFDQKQKRLGLPTSDELTTNDILEKAKYLPGSPFLPDEDS